MTTTTSVQEINRKDFTTDYLKGFVENESTIGEGYPVAFTAGSIKTLPFKADASSTSFFFEFLFFTHTSTKSVAD